MTADAEIINALKAAVGAAASDPMVPSAIAAVSAPRLGLSWCGASRGALGSGVTPSAEQSFRIASTTKMYVATAFMRLAERGDIDLAAPIAGMVAPEIRVALERHGHDTSRMTLFHLLTHTSGLLDHVQTATYSEAVVKDPARRWTREEQIAWALAAGGPLGEPGAIFRYSDTGYVILGDILERLTSKTLGAAVRDLCAFERLGLRQTHWEQVDAPPAVPGRARQYMSSTDMTEADPSFDLFGGGGLVSSVDEMVRFCRAAVRGDLFQDSSAFAACLVVPPAQRTPDQYVHGPVFMSFPVGNGWGLGHAGFWGCVAVHRPDLDLTIAATVNQARPATANLLRTFVAALARPFER